MLRTLAAAAVSVAALALPAAGLAMNGPTGGAPVAPASASPTNYLRDAKYTPTPIAATPVKIVRIVKPAGFDVHDAAIGAVLGALALALLGGVVLVVLRDRGTGRITAGTRA
jgi:hypothetical protein